MTLLSQSNTLFPALDADSQWLPVSDGHCLYVETCGNPQGVPVLVVHGGPGGGINARMRQYFDPQYWRIILFDQRGSGQSTPYASLENNTTTALLNDIEQLRQHLGIDRWWLFGGSWGSTLSLLYAEAYPQHCLGLILRGIFLARREDLDWLYGASGAAKMYPAEWDNFVARLPATDLDTVLNYYQQKMAQPTAQALPWAKRWAQWEAKLSTIMPSSDAESSFDQRALAIARIENHYFCHQSFIEENQILSAISRIAKLPGYIIQGQHDMVCPANQAWLLSKLWPSASLRMVAGAGHSSAEAGIEQALLRAVADAAEIAP